MYKCVPTQGVSVWLTGLIVVSIHKVAAAPYHYQLFTASEDIVKNYLSTGSWTAPTQALGCCWFGGH